MQVDHKGLEKLAAAEKGKSHAPGTAAPQIGVFGQNETFEFQALERRIHSETILHRCAQRLTYHIELMYN